MNCNGKLRQKGVAIIIAAAVITIVSFYDNIEPYKVTHRRS
jgi:hypothetical protein